MIIWMIVLGAILFIPFVCEMVQISYRDAIGHGDCGTLFDKYQIPIMFLAIVGVAFMIMGM